MLKKSLTGLAALSLALLLAPTAEAKKKKTLIEFVPEQLAEGPIYGEFGWMMEGPGYQIRLQRLDDAGRRAFIRETTGSGTDPFARPPEHPGFLTFRVDLTNLGADNLSLRVEDCWLIGGKKTKVQYPIDLQTMQTNFRMMGQELPTAYEQAGQALLGSQVHPKRGETVSGLLVFRQVVDRTRQFVVELRPMTTFGQVGVHRAPYRRVKRKVPSE